MARKPEPRRPSRVRTPPAPPQSLTVIERRLAEILAEMELPIWPLFSEGPYQLDFALEKHLVDIEADGELYHSSLEAAARRDQKDAWLEAKGYRILHLTGSVIMNDRPLVRRLVAQTVAGARPRPKPPAVETPAKPK